MHKLIPFILFVVSLWYYIYKSKDINSKGLKRIILSIKMTIIIALVLLGSPTYT